MQRIAGWLEALTRWFQAVVSLAAFVLIAAVVRPFALWAGVWVMTHAILALVLTPVVLWLEMKLLLCVVPIVRTLDKRRRIYWRWGQRAERRIKGIRMQIAVGDVAAQTANVLVVVGLTREMARLVSQHEWTMHAATVTLGEYLRNLVGG